MACCHPLLAIDYGIDSDTGKHRINILSNRFDASFTRYKSKYGDMLLELPCGKCIDCRATKAKDWSVRCYLESLSYQDNCFLTLTYNDDDCPDFLVKRDLQLFLKRLRNHIGEYRYFACGEYGSRTKRPHFHIILFGFIPPDLVSIGSSKKGSKLFTSDLISKLWTFGFHTVGMLEPASICYCARYNTKKLNSSTLSKDKREFIIMSRRPGLGHNWLVSHIDDICNNLGTLYLGEFGIKNSSRYILNLVKNYEPFTYNLIKDENLKRCKDMALHNLLSSGASNEDERLSISLDDAIEKEGRVRRGL